MHKFTISGVEIYSIRKYTIDTNTLYYQLRVDLAQYGFEPFIKDRDGWVYALYVPSRHNFRDCIERFLGHIRATLFVMELQRTTVSHY